mmetsp:Transcript_47924/g.63427  ORF Transcript_47924/g.63427 Transcript_47924/m.63427 type:complete len:164 (+) Transcript_47924:349-840(+)
MGLSEPKTLSYLNTDPIVVDQSAFGYQAPLTITVSLSSKVVKQKRMVYDIFMLFGDVGGFYDFFVIALATIFGATSEKLRVADLVSQLYHTDQSLAGPRDRVACSSTKTRLDMIQGISFSGAFMLLNTVSCGLYPLRGSKRKKALRLGSERVDRHLDVVRLVH